MSRTKLEVLPFEAPYVLKDRIYDALKQAIVSMNIYATDSEMRLDERQLAEDLGVSRTPIREAIARLEQEGLVKTVPRRGAFVVRKTKKEVLEMIHVWAALESMAARMITLHASDEEISKLRELFVTFNDNKLQAHIDEYSEKNIEFHQAIITMSGCALISDLTENLFLHMHSIRDKTIAEKNRVSRSIKDHMHIIEALENRDTDLAEQLVRQHTLDLAKHVEENVHWLS